MIAFCLLLSLQKWFSYRKTYHQKSQTFLNQQFIYFMMVFNDIWSSSLYSCLPPCLQYSISWLIFCINLYFNNWWVLFSITKTDSMNVMNACLESPVMRGESFDTTVGTHSYESLSYATNSISLQTFCCIQTLIHYFYCYSLQTSLWIQYWDHYLSDPFSIWFWLSFCFIKSNLLILV